MAGKLHFIRKNGRIIPIGARGTSSAHKVVKHVVGGAALGATAVGITTLKPSSKQKFKVNSGFDVTGLGLSVVSGALAAATFSSPKRLVLGHAATMAIDVGSVAANIASVAGSGNKKERALQAAKQESRNFAVGNAVFALGVLGVKKNRQALAGYSSKILSMTRRVLGVRA